VRFLTVTLLLLATPLAARADEHEAYEETQPAIDDVPAIAHPELRWHPTWQTLHRVNLEFTGMLVGLYGDHGLVLKLRNLEPVDWAARLSGARGVRVIGVNVSHSGTLGDPNLGPYLRDRGVSDEAARRGQRFLLADGSIAQGTTMNAIVNAAFSPDVQAAHAPVSTKAIANFVEPEKRAWVALRAFAGDGILQAGSDAELQQNLYGLDVGLVTTWEFSTNLPHVTGNSDHFAQRSGRWAAMVRRDRNVWSADNWAGESPTAEAERERGLRFMEDAKAFFTAEPNRKLLRQRVAMWRTLRRNADRGRWDRVADLIDTHHQRDPGFGEALSRDVLGMLGSGHARQKPELTHDDLMRARGVAPVAPWLIQKLRAEPRRGR
jgi:hypothetical protein